MHFSDHLNAAETDERPTGAQWPCRDPEIDAALQRMLADGSWGRYDGRHSQQLVDDLAEFHQLPFAYLCSSGTFAVELALRAVGVSAGDEVVLAAYDFPGNFRAIEAIGAAPVLVDIEAQTCCLDARYLAEACGSGRVRAILVSHLHGGLADMKSICQFAEQRGISIVEDACQAQGAEVQGRVAGTWGDVGVLSFGGSKLLTAGRGGALLTRRADVLQRAKIYCERGNHAFPLSELQAAVLRPQLAKLAARNRVRQAQVAALFQILAADDQKLTPITAAGRGDASYYKVGWRVATGRPSSRERVLQAVQKLGIDIGPGFRGFFKRGAGRCRRIGEVEQSRAAAEHLIVLHHPWLLAATSDDLQRLASTLRAAVAE